MIQKEELLRVPAFAGLPDDQLEWFLAQSQELNVKAGETVFRQEDPADAMFIALEGQLQARGEFNGEPLVFPIDPGDIGGTLPYSRMKQFVVTVSAIVDSRALRFPAASFPELIYRMPELTRRLVEIMSDRIREATRFEQHRDRLAALGKLSAGLAHELNNPASAAKRATSQLRETLVRLRDASHELGRRELTQVQRTEVEKLEAMFSQRDGAPPDLLTASAREEEIDDMFRRHGLTDLWQLAADLAKRNVDPVELNALFDRLDAETARLALVRIAASVEVADVLNEIESSASRISDLVSAIKEYTFMDQTTVQSVDLVKGLETTLVIMNHKLRKGVEVKRDYRDTPLLVDSFGSELNQVWTNIIDNAIDAMSGKGELRIHTSLQNGCAYVEIGDNGPGIPPEIEPRIFEPFFTTKRVGEGTGLGLDTVQRIVRKHRGNVQVESKPGDTRFQVWLPLSSATK
jgi:signal transduction histidine kinase